MTSIEHRDRASGLCGCLAQDHVTVVTHTSTLTHTHTNPLHWIFIGGTLAPYSWVSQFVKTSMKLSLKFGGNTIVFVSMP